MAARRLSVAATRQRGSASSLAASPYLISSQVPSFAEAPDDPTADECARDRAGSLTAQQVEGFGSCSDKVIFNLQGHARNRDQYASSALAAGMWRQACRSRRQRRALYVGKIAGWPAGHGLFDDGPKCRARVAR